MSTRKSTAEKIEAAKIEKQQAEARLKNLLQEQKSEERKARNHRLCKRGGQVEKLLPSLAILTDEQFETFVQKTLLSGFAEKVLRGLVPPTEATAEPESDTGTIQGGEDIAAKPTATAQKVGATLGVIAEQAVRVAS